jgi:glucokinase
VREIPDDAEVRGVGIGSAGPIAIDEGEISPLNMPECRDFPIARIVAEASGQKHITLRLDGLCITLAEHWTGALTGYRNALGMIVSTGIGGGILADGKLLAGRSGNAGHVGQVRVSAPTGPGPDYASTLEGTAAGPHIVAWAREHGWSGTTGEELSVSYAQGDPIAIAAVRRCGETLGIAIAAIAAVTDLEAVAIGGGFSRVTPDLFTIAQEALHDRTTLVSMRGIVILPSALSDEGPLIGAAGLIHRADLVPDHP